MSARLTADKYIGRDGGQPNDERSRDAIEQMKPILEHLTPDEVAEVAAGLIGLAYYRAMTQEGDDRAIELIDSLSSFTTGMHFDARRAKFAKPSPEAA